MGALQPRPQGLAQILVQDTNTSGTTREAAGVAIVAGATPTKPEPDVTASPFSPVRTPGLLSRPATWVVAESRVGTVVAVKLMPI
jgi:hypothetical protein